MTLRWDFDRRWNHMDQQWNYVVRQIDEKTINSVNADGYLHLDDSWTPVFHSREAAERVIEKAKQICGVNAVSEDEIKVKSKHADVTFKIEKKKIGSSDFYYAKVTCESDPKIYYLSADGYIFDREYSIHKDYIVNACQKFDERYKPVENSEIVPEYEYVSFDLLKYDFDKFIKKTPMSSDRKMLTTLYSQINRLMQSEYDMYNILKEAIGNPNCTLNVNIDNVKRVIEKSIAHRLRIDTTNTQVARAIFNAIPENSRSNWCNLTREEKAFYYNAAQKALENIKK